LRSTGFAPRPATDLQVGDRLRDLAAHFARHARVDADADDDRRRAERIAVDLDQDAAELVVAEHEVVRPLEVDAVEAFLLERARDGDADGERQAREEAGALLEAPAHRERDRAAGDGGPRAAAAAAAGGLPFGGEHGAVDVAARRAAKQLGRRRVELVGDLDLQRRGRAVERRAVVAVQRQVFLDRHLRLGDRRAGLRDLRAELGERKPHGGGVEEIGGGLQAIAEPAHPLERKPGGLSLTQELRDTGARKPHLRGEVFARVEIAVRELAQQRETERSEH
jgi:hypothetical protein